MVIRSELFGSVASVLAVRSLSPIAGGADRAPNGPYIEYTEAQAAVPPSSNRKTAHCTVSHYF